MNSKQKRDKRRKRIEQKVCTECGKIPLAPTSTRMCVPCFKRDLARHKKNRQRIQLRAFEYCGSQCFDCALQSPYFAVYDFHHLRDKKYELHRLLGARYSWKTIVEELDKCLMLCANCHRIRHAKEHEDKQE